MSSNFSRRDFMKTAGTTAGFMIASGYSPFTYAKNSIVNVACIGTGGQGGHHIRDGLAGTEDALIVAVCDVYELHQKQGQLLAMVSNAKIQLAPGEELTDAQKAQAKAAHKPAAFYDYQEMLATQTDIDAVVIATPIMTHYKIAMDCLDAKKFTFCEKTMCGNVEEARGIVQKCHETGLWVQVGHQRRYAPEYNMAMAMARNGVLGRINHMDMQWHRNHYWRRPLDVSTITLNDIEKKYIPDVEKHLNWRIYDETSGGLCTELLTHQIDIANWFTGCLPNRVVGGGSIDYWRDGRTVEDNISVIFDYKIESGSEGFCNISKRSKFQNLSQLNKSYNVRAMYSSILANAKRGASELIQGDEGAIELTEAEGCWWTPESHALERIKAVSDAQQEEAAKKAAAEAAAAAGQAPAAPAAPAKTEAEKAADMVTSGGSRYATAKKVPAQKLEAIGMDVTSDKHQFRAFTHHIKNGGMPRTNQMVGLGDTVVAWAAFQAIREQKSIDIDPAVGKFDFEVPSENEYAYEGEVPSIDTYKFLEEVLKDDSAAAPASNA
ncbi:MAG: Gfo/Idh/MocA family oxidoreductase [Candidatus Hydrogenedentes bacterium]|nr:Gfo/Idh/MocA family oxidoreductase [Candidatus Hydrogenedentota bacterium]